MHINKHSTALPPEDRARHGEFRIQLGDHFITVRRQAASGPDLLLVHGLGSSGETWDSLLEPFSAWFSPMTFDLRGHGQSGRPGSGYLNAHYASDLDAILDAFAIERPLLIGHSLGGLVVLTWAARHPDRAAAIVIEDSPLRSGEAFGPMFDDMLARQAMPVEELARQYLERRPEWTAEQARRRAEIATGVERTAILELREDSFANDGLDLIASIEHIQSPLLLVHGDAEAGSMVHPDDREQLVSRLARVEVAHIPEAGHSIHSERTDAFLDAVVPFLRRHAG